MINKKLQNEILAMVEKDQKMRAGKNWNKKIDEENTKKLKAIIQKYGWPDFDLVGKKASDGAWLLAQHADHDIKFQEKCLKLMMGKLKKGKINPQNIAYLTDRILVNKNLKQLYGTQFHLNKQNKFIPRPIKDIKNLNKRRKLFGLGNFEKYKKIMERKNKELKRRAVA